ncbi:MAG: hypothetical protein HC828_17820 [Blastochloris sp.]|nr:hypothetical protein [Blastochloris sp.]
MQQAVTELAPQIGVARAGAVLGVPRSGYYRHQARAAGVDSAPLPRSPGVGFWGRTRPRVKAL